MNHMEKDKPVVFTPPPLIFYIAMPTTYLIIGEVHVYFGGGGVGIVMNSLPCH